ncbi:MAG: hypothetical protein EA352_04855 [Gemmatimonadales bacterium]|nr:MAG: hypothetical protein EA352_04855 [Gemmatimonadales bacterium]
MPFSPLVSAALALFLLAGTPPGPDPDPGPDPTPDPWGGEITGHVLEDGTSHPVAHALVWFEEEGRIATWTRTGEDGSFTLDHPGPRLRGLRGPDRQMIRVVAPDHIPVTHSFGWPCAPESYGPGRCPAEVDVRMQPMALDPDDSAPTCRVQGTVLFGDRVVNDARIRMDAHGLEATSDDQGRYTLEDVPAGFSVQQAAAIGFHQNERPVVVACPASDPVVTVDVAFTLMPLSHPAPAPHPDSTRKRP